MADEVAPEGEAPGTSQEEPPATDTEAPRPSQEPAATDAEPSQGEPRVTDAEARASEGEQGVTNAEAPSTSQGLPSTSADARQSNKPSNYKPSTDGSKPSNYRPNADGPKPSNYKPGTGARARYSSSSKGCIVKLRHQRTPSDSANFKDLAHQDAQVQVATELEKLARTTRSASDKKEIERDFIGFQKLFSRFLNQEGPLDWDKIQKLPDDIIQDYDTLPAPNSSAEIRSMLNKLVVVKLNGGLGTSMGCKGPKSIIPVRSDLTFLDLSVQQIEHLNRTFNADVPLVLMNSFNTDEDTLKVIRKYKGFQVKLYTFNQSQYPRINRETLMPIAKTCCPEEDLDAWYPPGHGDFYESFMSSGLLNKFIEEGREFCFISNIDNLGATVDLNICKLLMDRNNATLSNGNTECPVHPEFLMEVTDKTRADVKGGTLIFYEDKLRLLEIAQVPKQHVDDFKSVKKFKIFNTNNLWIKLDSITRVIEQGTLDMDVIVNNKTLDNGLNIIQLETAVGSATKCFEGGLGINVPRSRFLPVKKTQDLLLVMSNLYHLKNGSLGMSSQRMFPATPLVKLGDNHFGKVKDFLKRFESIPDILELDHVTVSGDVTFGRAVSLKGTVIIIANHGDRIDIPSGSILENKIVSGNLRILDH